MKEATIISIVGIICLTILQLYAWYCGHNGAVFAFTSAVIGLIIGKALDVKVSLGQYIKENPP